MDTGSSSATPSALTSIFVIDDDAETRATTAHILRGAGYRVQATTSDLGSIEDLKQLGVPDLVILGLVPCNSDWDRHAKSEPPSVLRSEPSRPSVFARSEPHASTVSDAPTLALREAAAIDSDAFLPPPFTASELLRAVEAFLAVSAEMVVSERPAIVDLGAVLEVSLRLAWRELAERAHVTCEFDRQLRVRANPEQLCLVFLNLLLNAAGSIDEGKAEANGIRVAGWRTAHGRTVVEISDTGKGIGGEQLAHLFDAGISKHAQPRSGLDLARSQQIVNAVGGSITVTSTLGGGASFRVELPTA